MKYSIIYTIFFRMGFPGLPTVPTELFLSAVMMLATSLADYSEKNPFTPAEPGHTPKCAKMGTSFCEDVDIYPE